MNSSVEREPEDERRPETHGCASVQNIWNLVESVVVPYADKHLAFRRPLELLSYLKSDVKLDSQNAKSRAKKQNSLVSTICV